MAEEHWSESAQQDNEQNMSNQPAGNAVQDCPLAAPLIVSAVTPVLPPVIPADVAVAEPPRPLADVILAEPPPIPADVALLEPPPVPADVVLAEPPPVLADILPVEPPPLDPKVSHIPEPFLQAETDLDVPLVEQPEAETEDEEAEDLEIAARGKAGSAPPETPFPAFPASQATDWIEVVVVDESGQPVANEPYQLTLPDGTVQKGTLDAQGKLRIENIAQGTCKISLPNRKDDQWEPFKEGADTEPPEETAEAAQETAWMEIELVDDQGNPVGFEAYEIILPDGTVKKGSLDAEGRARVEGLGAEPCKIRFPKRGEDDRIEKA